MNQKEISDTYKKIQNLLNNKQLKDSFDALETYLSLLQNWSLSERKAELENNYKLMLQYAVDGVQDPERQLIYNKLITSVYELADETKEAMMVRFSTAFDYEQIRMYTISKPPRLQQIIAELLDYQSNMELLGMIDNETVAVQKQDLHKRYESVQIALYNKIWLTPYFGAEENSRIKDLMANGKIDVNDKCLLITALTMNILRNFDEEKILLLFDFYAQNEEAVKQRALVGIMLVMYLFDSRLHLYPTIRNRLMLQADDNEFKRNVQFIIIQFIRSKDTEDISKKLITEIFPEMMKLRPLMKNKVDFEEVNSVEDFEEKNPEWQEIIENSGIGDKLQEISELQIDGADVFMGTFAPFKHFPFFNMPSNWFLPFDSENSAVRDLFKGKEHVFLKLLLKSNFMCNSDKYSFALSIEQMPENQRKSVTSSFKLEAEQLEEIAKDDNILKATAKKENISNQYLQDLYRFYKLHHSGIHMTDIFSLPLDFQNTWFYENIGFSQADLREIAEYYFLKKRYAEALDIYLRLLEKEKDNAELYQKAGYCYQHFGKIKQALDYYLLAETILTDNKWTIKRLAFCYRVLKNDAKALEYYRRLEQMNPQDVSNQLNIGHCLLEMKNYKDALNIYFKLEFSMPENVKVWRAIAWGSFLSGKLEQAQRYYTKLLKHKPDSNDLLNAGHAEWAMGERKKALDFYLQSIKQNKGNLNEFLSAFDKDIPDLTTSGIAPEEMPMMMDELKYMIKN